MTDAPPPHAILKEGGDVYKTKNEDYGDSWRDVGRILHLLADGETIELETVQDHISYGLFTRRLDKLARAYHGEFIDDDPNHEPVVDAHEDEMVYAAMSATNLLSDYGHRRTGKENRGTDTGEREGARGAAELSAAAREVSDAVERLSGRDSGG